MKYIKTYETFIPEYGKDWKIGDVVVAIKNMYAGGSNWLKEGEKYIIQDIVGDRIRVETNFLFLHDKGNFVTPEEWELGLDTNKYNI